jgi:hypothetical protein
MTDVLGCPLYEGQILQEPQEMEEPIRVAGYTSEIWTRCLANSRQMIYHWTGIVQLALNIKQWRRAVANRKEIWL